MKEMEAMDAMKTITDLHQLLDAVGIVCRKFSTEAWWQGQPAAMDVYPSVFRKDLFRDGWTAQKERDLAIRFLMGASMRHTRLIADDDAHSLALMRHHGLATRLLDWTCFPLFEPVHPDMPQIMPAEALDPCAL